MNHTEEANYGPAWSLLSIGFFGLTNLLLRPLTPFSARNNPTQIWKWRNTANSMLHSTLTGIWALLCFYWEPKMAEDLISTYSNSSHLLVSVSVALSTSVLEQIKPLVFTWIAYMVNFKFYSATIFCMILVYYNATGYFIYDFLDMALHHRKRSSYELMVHHLCVIMCFGLSELTKNYIGYTVVALLVEVNSIFLHLRQLLIIQGFSKHEPTYRLNSLLNIGTFLVFRIMTLGWMTRWLVLHRDEVPFFAYTLGTVSLAIIVLMNIILFFRILHVDFFAKKHEKPTQLMKEAKVE